MSKAHTKNERAHARTRTHTHTHLSIKHTQKSVCVLSHTLKHKHLYCMLYTTQALFRRSYSENGNLLVGKRKMEVVSSVTF